MTTFRYSVSYGLQGCYMRDSMIGPYTGTTRRELAAMIHDALAFYDMPARKAREVKLIPLWQFIKRHGSSSAHFHITDGEHNVLSFNGLTESKCSEMEREQDY